MIIDWLKSNHFWDFRERGVQDTLWFQRQMLKKRYQNKKQDQLYNKHAKMNRSSVKIRLT